MCMVYAIRSRIDVELYCYLQYIAGVLVKYVWYIQYIRASTLNFIVICTRLQGVGPICMVYAIHLRIDVTLYCYLQHIALSYLNLFGIYNTSTHRRQIVLLFTIHCARLVKFVWYIQYIRAPASDCIAIYNTSRGAPPI